MASESFGFPCCSGLGVFFYVKLTLCLLQTKKLKKLARRLLQERQKVVICAKEKASPAVSTLSFQDHVCGSQVFGGEGRWR